MIDFHNQDGNVSITNSTCFWKTRAAGAAPLSDGGQLTLNSPASPPISRATTGVAWERIAHGLKLIGLGLREKLWTHRGSALCTGERSSRSRHHLCGQYECDEMGAPLPPCAKYISSELLALRNRTPEKWRRDRRGGRWVPNSLSLTASSPGNTQRGRRDLRGIGGNGPRAVVSSREQAPPTVVAGPSSPTVMRPYRHRT